MPEHQGVRLLDGDYLLVELLERPPARLGILDDGSRGEDRLLEETMSEASSSSDGNYEGPAIFVVHRPRFRVTDSRVCWPKASEIEKNQSRLIFSIDIDFSFFSIEI